MGRTDVQAYELRARLDQDGFVTIPNAFTATEIKTIRAACQGSIDLTRKGRWPYFRSLPKQFPPWSNDVSQGIWGVQSLLHPDMPGRDVYIQTYFGDPVVDAVTSILDCEDEDLVMELYNMLIRPDHDFALRWHRDNISSDASPDEELRSLQEPILHTQWNLALYPDHSLIVVPGSHKRARTDEERAADPFEDDLPGQEVVHMQPGDMVFYNNNILHRGVYDSTVERMTLHGSMGLVKADPARGRNILQHGIGDWAPQCDFGHVAQKLASRAEHMKHNLIACGTTNYNGYTHPD